MSIIQEPNKAIRLVEFIGGRFYEDQSGFGNNSDLHYFNIGADRLARHLRVSRDTHELEFVSDIYEREDHIPFAPGDVMPALNGFIDEPSIAQLFAGIHDFRILEEDRFGNKLEFPTLQTAGSYNDGMSILLQVVGFQAEDTLYTTVGVISEEHDVFTWRGVTTFQPQAQEELYQEDYVADIHGTIEEAEKKPYPPKKAQHAPAWGGVFPVIMQALGGSER